MVMARLQVNPIFSSNFHRQVAIAVKSTTFANIKSDAHLKEVQCGQKTKGSQQGLKKISRTLCAIWWSIFELFKLLLFLYSDDRSQCLWQECLSETDWNHNFSSASWKLGTRFCGDNTSHRWYLLSDSDYGFDCIGIVGICCRLESNVIFIHFLFFLLNIYEKFLETGVKKS